MVQSSWLNGVLNIFIKLSHSCLDAIFLIILSTVLNKNLTGYFLDIAWRAGEYQVLFNVTFKGD